MENIKDIKKRNSIAAINARKKAGTGEQTKAKKRQPKRQTEKKVNNG